MAEIIEVQANIDDLNKQLDEADKRFEQTEKSAQGLGDTTTDSSKKAAKSINEVTAALKKEEDEQKRLTKVIREQESITIEFRQEMNRLTKAYNEAGKSGTMNGMRIKKQMDSLNVSIKDQILSVRKLKNEQKESASNIKGLKAQKKQLEANTKQTGVFSGAIGKLGAVMAGAFAAERIGSFLIDAVTAADRAQGITAAFERTGVSIDELRDKTRGVVSDVELMRAAVNARNLGVPVEELGGLLGFASSRARETGETVDGLVNSIVTGLGRKSTLVLDNLGVSAIDLKKELGDVGVEQASVAQLTAALNKVIEDQAEGLEDDISQLQRANASYENMKIAIGEALLPVVNEASKAFADLADDVSLVASSDTISGWEKLGIVLGGITGTGGTGLSIAAARMEAFGVALKSIENNGAADEIAKINDELRKQLGLVDDTDGKGIIESLREQVKENKKLLELETEKSMLPQRRQELAAAEASLAAALGKTKDAAEEAGKAQIKMITDLDEAWNNREYGNQEAGPSVDDIYEQELNAQIEANEAKAKNDQDYADYQIQLQQEVAAAQLQATNNFFEAFKILAGDNAEAQKALAIFQATVNAYVAITQALANAPNPIVGAVLATSIGAMAFAQVAKIASQEVPSFYTGTDYVQLNGNRDGRDTIPAMLNKGEGVVTTEKNKRYKGAVKAMNAGTFDKYIASSSHMKSALESLKKEQEQEKAALLSAAIRGSVDARLDDSRILRELKRSRYVNEEMAYLLAKSSIRKNPYRR